MSYRKPRFLVVIGALAATGLLASCASSAANSSNPESNGAPVSGGTIVYAHDQEPPCLWGGWIQQAYISRQFLDSLTSQVEDGEVVPWLATDWEVSEDQKTWTFEIKKDIKFTDGTPLDAEAVRRNFEYWINEGGNSTADAYLGPYYETSTALDTHTFELTLKEPYSPLLTALSQAYFGIQSPAALDRDADVNCEKPVGSGPFYVEEWARGSHVTLKRNDDYNSAPQNARHEGPAYVDEIVWRFVHDPVARFGALTTGEAHAIYDVPTPQWEIANEQYQVEKYVTPGRPMSLALNTVDGVFTDKLVRQAFAYATDRKTAVETAFNGVTPFEPNAVLSRTTPSYNDSVADLHPYDPEEAEKLLDAAGWVDRDADGFRVKDGERLYVKLTYGAGSHITPEGTAVLQNLQHNAQAVGFDLELVPATQDELFAGKYSTPDSYDAKPGYWTSPSPGVLLINYRQNLPPESPNTQSVDFYNDPEVEDLIRAANSTLERAKQDEYYGEAQRILNEEAVSVGLYNQLFTLAVDPNLKDVWLESAQGEPVFHDAYFVQ